MNRPIRTTSRPKYEEYIKNILVDTTEPTYKDAYIEDLEAYCDGLEKRLLFYMSAMSSTYGLGMHPGKLTDDDE